ncbi:MAG: glycosyltransferase family 4 protein [Aphanocapsa sp. GSE-SYN-MK-11-07L]|jgi:glycosyltransferase involved in cell wall biosynthesis|nr:glycosyltransferase family 4 protein [Aphanocapsa sp. GSE-SYN-MK-11-07L]
MGKTKILLAQLGARKHYQEPLLFHRWGILDRIYTDFYSGHSQLANSLRDPKIYKILPSLLKKILDRYEPGLENAEIIHFPKFGYQNTRKLKNALPEELSQIFVSAGQEFCQRIIQRGLGNANTIYGFNSACLELFKYAKTQNIRCILDQTFVDWSLAHQLLLEEEKRWDGWSLTPVTVNYADIQLMEREHDEQDLADHIICGSTFVKDSLIARKVDESKIFVVPLGRLKDEKSSPYQSLTKTPLERGDELRILFVGSVSLRKGIPYLLEALRQIKREIPFICKVVGSLEIKPERIVEYGDVCEFLGRIPRSQVKDLYTWADVFVLPSVSEGSAMVTYEAMSMGVPVITTKNSGSIVRDGIDGFIMSINEISSIADNLIKIYLTTINKAERRGETQQYLDDVFNESEKTLQKILIQQ